MKLKSFNPTTITVLPDPENIIVRYFKNEEFDNAEVNFYTTDRSTFTMFDRISLNNSTFDWYISSSITKSVEVETGTYLHQLLLIELTEKLKNWSVPNLSFNNFVSTPIYNNLFDIVDRIRKVVPFELDKDQDTTRLWQGTRNSNDEEWKEKGYTEKLYNILINYTNIKEYKFVDRNAYEVLSEIFLEIGGVPKLITSPDSFNDTVLDIELFDEETEELNINYDAYEEIKNINYYGNTAEVITNNIIDSNSLYESGLVNGKVLQSLDVVFDENGLATYRSEVELYRLSSAEVAVINESTFYDITDYVFEEEEHKLLLDKDPDELDPFTLQNTVMYKIGDKEVNGWGKEAAKSVVVFTTTVWSKLFESAGVPNFITENEVQRATNLVDYKFKFVFEPLLVNNRFTVKSSTLAEDNKKAAIRINTGERINEFNKIVKSTKNKISRLGNKIINKVVKHNSLDELYKLGTLDTDTGFKIVAIEAEYVNDSVKAIYSLTEDINIISDLVGVNSELRFTDAQIGGGLIRNEVYEDYVLIDDFGSDVYNNLDDGRDANSSLTLNGLLEYSRMFTTSNAKTKYSHVLLSGNSGGILPTIIPPITSGAESLVKFKIPLFSQTYTDNKIVLGSEVQANTDKYIEQGVRYSENDGTLDTISLVYGYTVTQSNSESDIRNLPEAGTLVDTTSNSLWEIGTIQTNITSSTQSLSGGVKNFEDAEFGDVIELVNTYDIDSTYESLTLDWGTNIDKVVKYSKELVVEIRLSSGSFKEIYRNKIDIPGSIITTPPNTPITTETINLERTSGNQLRITNKFIHTVKPLAGIQTKISGTISTLNLSLDTITASTEEDFDGLVVEKNPNEILRLDYINHVSTNEQKKYIIGEVLTDKNRIINTEFDGWESVKVYRYSGKYTQYDTNIIKGTEWTGVTVQAIKSNQGDWYEISIKNNVTGLNELIDTTIAFVGVKNSVENLILARNFINGDTERIITITSKHFHPLEVINY